MVALSFRWTFRSPANPLNYIGNESLKFGGSSVAKPERILRIVEILKGYYTKGEKFTVVFLLSVGLPIASLK